MTNPTDSLIDGIADNAGLIKHKGQSYVKFEDVERIIRQHEGHLTDINVGQLLADMRVQVQWSDKATMPIPLYERMKAALSAISNGGLLRQQNSNLLDTKTREDENPANDALIEKLEELAADANRNINWGDGFYCGLKEAIAKIRQHQADIRIENDRVCIAGRWYVPADSLGDPIEVFGLKPHDILRLKTWFEAKSGQSIGAFWEQAFNAGVRHERSLQGESGTQPQQEKWYKEFEEWLKTKAGKGYVSTPVGYAYMAYQWGQTALARELVDKLVWMRDQENPLPGLQKAINFIEQHTGVTNDQEN